MNTLRLTSGYLPFSTLSGRYPSFFWVCVPIGPNFGIFWAITLVKKMSDWAEIWTIVSSHKYLRYISCFLKNSNFLRPQDELKVSVFSATWAQFIPWRSPKSTKVNILNEKIYPLGYPNIQKSEPYLVPILNYFFRYLVFFWAKMGIKVKDQEVKDQVSTTFFRSPF